MLRDADPNYFKGIYIVCGYTDLRFGIDSLAAIIEQNTTKVYLSLTLCFFSAENPLPGLRGCFGKVMASCFFTNVWNPVISPGHAPQTSYAP